MRSKNRLDVPNELREVNLGPDSSKERREKFIKEVQKRRLKIQKGPTFDSIEEATAKAVQMYKDGTFPDPTVWKEPRDMGNRYSVVLSENRENAYFSGYKEVMDSLKIADISLGRTEKRIDHIEEV